MHTLGTYTKKATDQAAVFSAENLLVARGSHCRSTPQRSRGFAQARVRVSVKMTPWRQGLLLVDDLDSRQRRRRPDGLRPGMPMVVGVTDFIK